MTVRRWSWSLLAIGALGCLAVGCGSPSIEPSATTSRGSTATTFARSTDPSFQPGRHRLSLTVDGTERTATVVVPNDLSHDVPLVFVFHGHGGSGNQVLRSLGIDGLWPEAIVVAPDGLVGHKGRTDPEGVRTGWQTLPGEDGDRDLHLYDALFAEVTGSLPVDRDRIYLMGHSNGSALTSLLLNVRGEAIAATANLSAQPGRYLDTDPDRSMFMMMGQTDPIVPYAGQKLSIPIAERKLGIDPSRTTTSGYLSTEHGRGQLELATYVHPAGHEVPKEVPPLIVAFFQRHTLSGG